MPTAGEAKIRPTSHYNLRNKPLPKTKSVVSGKNTIAEKENNQSQVNSGPVTRSKSKIPVVSSGPKLKPRNTSGNKPKRKGVPDFAKLHKQWQSKFEKGKAVTKKTCTQVREFDLTKPGTHFKSAYYDGQVGQAEEKQDACYDDQVEQPEEENVSTEEVEETKKSTSRKTLKSIPVPQGRRGRKQEEVQPHANNTRGGVSSKARKSLVQQQRDMGIDFKEDLGALASILSNTGVTHNRAAPPTSRQTFATSRGAGGPRGSLFGGHPPSQQRTSIYYQPKASHRNIYEDYTRLVMRRLTVGDDGILAAPSHAPSRTNSHAPTRSSIYYKPNQSSRKVPMKPLNAVEISASKGTPGRVLVPHQKKSQTTTSALKTPRTASRVPNPHFHSVLQKQEITSSPVLSDARHDPTSHIGSASCSKKVQWNEDTVAIPSAEELATSLFTQAEDQSILNEKVQQVAKLQEMEELEQQLELEIQKLSEMGDLEEGLVNPLETLKSNRGDVQRDEMLPQGSNPVTLLKDFERLENSTSGNLNNGALEENIQHNPSTVPDGHTSDIPRFHQSNIPQSYDKVFHSVVQDNKQSNVNISLSSQSVNMQQDNVRSENMHTVPGMKETTQPSHLYSLGPGGETSKATPSLRTTSPNGHKLQNYQAGLMLSKSINGNQQPDGFKLPDSGGTENVQNTLEGHFPSPIRQLRYQHDNIGIPIHTSVESGYRIPHAPIPIQRLDKGTPGIGFDATRLASMQQINSNRACVMPNSQYSTSTSTHQVYQQAISTSSTTQRTPVVDNGTFQMSSYLLPQPLLLQKDGVLYSPIAVIPKSTKVVTFASPQVIRPQSEHQGCSFRSTPHPGILKKKGHPFESDLLVEDVQGRLDFDEGHLKQNCPKNSSLFQKCQPPDLALYSGDAIAIRPTAATECPATGLQSQINDFLSLVRSRGQPSGQTVLEVSRSSPAGSLSLRGQMSLNHQVKSSASVIRDKTEKMFKEALLDQECSLYCLGLHGSTGNGNRANLNPVARTLLGQDDMHFCPIPILDEEEC